MKNKEQIAKIWDVLDSLNVDVLHNKQAIIKLENERETLVAQRLDVDLSSELTGSDLCKAMLARGDKHVMCKCWDSSYADIEQVVDVISGFENTAYKKLFAGSRYSWEYAVPINNQGEPLTQSDVGL